MRRVLSFLILLALARPSPGATDPRQEYAEVRRIALKDPRVQAAFEKANQRLNERILEIDPSLKPLVDSGSVHPQEPVEPRETRAEHHATPAATPASAHEHIIVKGETLTSIAGHYHVTVSALRTSNHISDERKLRVGQKLVIPSTAAPAPTPHPAEKVDDNGGWWNQLKKNM